MSHGTSIIRDGFEGDGDENWDSSAFDMIMVNETEAFLDEHLEKNRNDPFFVYFALGTVHVPHSPPDRYLDNTQARGKYQTLHLDMLGVMDKVVGSLVSMIEDRKLADDTVIIFSSDNGGLRDSVDVGHMTSGPLRGAKGEVYEGGHRVPLIIRQDKKFPAGQRREKLIGMNDIFATICDLAGVEVPVGSAQDSVSFARYIESSKYVEGLRKYLGHWRLGGKGPPGWSRAIRMGKFKLVQFPRENRTELYDLEDDISESRNIADSKWVIDRNIIGPMIDELKTLGPCTAGEHRFRKECKRNGFE